MDSELGAKLSQLSGRRQAESVTSSNILERGTNLPTQPIPRLLETARGYFLWRGTYLTPLLHVFSSGRPDPASLSPDMEAQ